MICIESPNPPQNYKLRFSLSIYTLTKSRLEARDGKLFFFTSLKLLCINILTITTETTTCPRGEIGRHKGLKILALWECQFESGRGHHF